MSAEQARRHTFLRTTALLAVVGVLSGHFAEAVFGWTVLGWQLAIFALYVLASVGGEWKDRTV